MGKKMQPPKDSDTATTSQSDAVSAPSNIFKSLFGDAGRSTSASIFSESNPFKRKPQETIQTHDVEISPNVFHKVKKAKRPVLDDDSVEGGAKKIKKAETQLGCGSIELSGEMGSDSEKGIRESEVGFDTRKKKKRKRDEIERDYEAKKYGSVPDDEGKNVAGHVVVGEKRKKSDDAEHMLVSKEGEGFDDENKLLRTVFVGNLPLKVKKKAVMKEFGHFGEIESVRIRSVPIADTKIPRKGAVILKKINDSVDSVHAYIVFKTEQSAEASLAHNMAVVGGNHIRVDRACPPRKKLKGADAPLYDTKRTVFVGNLPFDVKDEELYQLFSGIKDLESCIEAVRVIRDPHVGLGKGIAYVLFKTREAANFAIKTRNLKLRDRELRLAHARRDATPSKRRNPFSLETSNTAEKKFAVDSSTKSHSGSKTKANLSYQGLRASKSGVQKKVHPKRNGVMKKNPNNSKKVEKREGKRPAVVARKAIANARKDAGASNYAGKKRKLDGWTPDSSLRKKKARRT